MKLFLPWEAKKEDQGQDNKRDNKVNLCVVGVFDRKIWVV